MKFIYAGVLLNLVLVLIFGLVYWQYGNEFSRQIDKNRHNVSGNLFDFFYLSITIQAGVGYLGLIPISDLGKLLLMIQQLCMITSNIIVVYLIHLHFFSM
jgi:hypothetical protein